jgi:hypothetical protein
MRHISILSGVFMAAVLWGCNSADVPTQGQSEGSHPQVQSAGNLIREFKVSNETSVRFQESQGIVTWSLEGSVDEKTANHDLERKLSAAKTMEAAYRVMDPTGPVPQALLDFDKRPLVQNHESAPPSGPLVGNSSGQSQAPSASLAKTASSLDDTWDWNADAKWWKQSVVGLPCHWHNAAYYTNVTWADDWRQGWFSKGYLMAAGFTYWANAYAYVWSNGKWVQTNSYYLQPRHYIIWASGDTQNRYRRYAVYGDGGAYARIHWGMRWDTQAPSDIDVTCFYD